MLRFQDLVMTNDAAEKWAACSVDVRIVLNIAFSDALRNPNLPQIMRSDTCNCRKRPPNCLASK